MSKHDSFSSELSETTNNGLQALIDAGVSIGAMEDRGTVFKAHDDGTPFLLVPQGFELKTLEAHLPAPLQVRSTVRLDDADSFIAYVNRYKDGASTVFADLAGRRFEAVIDYHESLTSARWGKHRALLACDVTQDWKDWAAHDGKPMSQVDFARFVEAHIPNIAQPAGAELLLMATTLEAKKDVQFRSSTRLANGEHQFRYEETIQGTAGSQQGLIQIPNEFVLGIEPFQGVGLRRLDARFRYRINQGELKLWFELVRPQQVLETAFTDVVSQIRTGLGNTLVLAGAAPAIA